MSMQFKRQGVGQQRGEEREISTCRLHSMAVEEEQPDTGQQDGYDDEDEAGDDFEDEDKEGEDGGEGDEDDEGSVLGEGQGEDIEDGREGKDDEQYEQTAPDPSDETSALAFLLN